MQITTIKIKDGRIIMFNDCSSIDSLIRELLNSLPNYPGKYDHWKVIKEKYLLTEVLRNPCGSDSFERQFGGNMCATEDNIVEYVRAANALLWILKFEMDMCRPKLIEDGEYCVSLHRETIFMSK